MKMKRTGLLLCSLLLSLFCGCQPLQVPVLGRQEPVELVLALPQNSEELIQECARELARRAEDFAQTSLTVRIVEEPNIWEALEQGEVDLILCSNEALVGSARRAGQLVEPLPPATGEEESPSPEPETLRGAAASFAMLDYPYFFPDVEGAIIGANQEDVLAALNHSLPEGFPMELRRISVLGQFHWSASPPEVAWDYFMELAPGEILQKQLDQGESLREPWGALNEGELFMRELDLSSGKSDLSDRLLILSGSRLKLLDIFVSPKALEKLNPRQQAAVEEAIVYSGGYGCTLGRDQEESLLEQLGSQGVQMLEPDREEWYETFQRYYRSGQSPVDSRLSDLLHRVVDRFRP